MVGWLGNRLVELIAISLAQRSCHGAADGGLSIFAGIASGPNIKSHQTESFWEAGWPSNPSQIVMVVLWIAGFPSMSKRVVRCRGGSRYVAGCWEFPYLKSLFVSSFLGFGLLVSWFQSFLVSIFCLLVSKCHGFLVSKRFKNNYLSALRAEPATVLSILVVTDKWGNSKINQKDIPKQLQKT